jgi:hypothetical protein
VGLFDSAVVKQLKKEAQFIGGVIAQQAFGELPPGTADEIVHGDVFSGRLETAFDAATAEMGDNKALKKATNAAADHARMFAQIRSIPPGDSPNIAEEAIKEMLAPELTP